MAKPPATGNRNGRRANNAKKWRTLVHKGPQFYPPYKRLGVHLFKYNRRIVPLTKYSEEVVVIFAKYLMRANRKRKGQAILYRNFFEDWREKYMSERERSVIKTFSGCDFSLVMNHLQQLAETRKSMSKRQKEKEMELKKEQKRKYQYVFINGRKEQVNNIMVEPPGLFMGRGDSKNIGRIKDRIEPEDVTINCSLNCRPRPPLGRHWKQKICDQTAIWLASYEDPVTGKMKYIFPHASSQIKSEKEQQKYKTAEELTLKINGIRRKYREHLKREHSLETRQHATALYLIDKCALRVGTEKGEGETDTVGCCTLRVEHVKLARNRHVQLNFIGKDSVPYDKTIIVSPNVYQNLRNFMSRKRKKELIFHEITATSLNDYLENMMGGLTAKVFRTFQATDCYRTEVEYFSRNLDKDSSEKEKYLAHLKANLEVAKLLNHVTMTRVTRAKENGLVRHTEKVKKMQTEFREIKRTRPKRGSEEFEEKEEKRSQLQVMKDELMIKKESMHWAMRTSLANYIDPRVVIIWCDKYGVNVEQVYSKTLQQKFRWAIETRRRYRVRTGRRRRMNVRPEPVDLEME